MKEKAKEKLNKHYYKYLYKEKYRNLLNDFLYFVVYKLVYRFYALQKVNKNLVLFVANKDTELPSDFKSLHKQAKKLGYKTLCIYKPASNSEILYVNELKKIRNDLMFTKYYATAKYTFVYDYYLPSFANKPRKAARLIQVWHGCGAFKKWGYSVKDSTWGLNSKFYNKYKIYKTYTDIFTSSAEIIPFYAEAFNSDFSKIKALGVARTDVFFNSDFVEQKRKEVYEKFKIDNHKKIIMWAPTFRGDSLNNSHNEITIDLEKLFCNLKDDYVLLIKLHPHLVKGFNARTFAPEYMKDFAIKPHPSYPIENLLCAADIVISDYSSLIFEYSLLERPMIFYPYDLEEYKKSRSFYYEYTDFVPGKIVHSSEEIIQEIRNIEEGFDKQRVTDFKNRFMSSCDGKSTERIFNEIIKEG